jgi:hypothetical protein
MAARKLAQRRVPGSERAVLDALHRTDLEEVDQIVAYLEAAHKLGARLSDEERSRLHDAAWQVRTAVEDWFPDL